MRAPTFHLQPGELDPEQPEVWGVLGLSPLAQMFLVRWYDADGHVVGVTVPDRETVAWAQAHREEVEATKEKAEAWAKKVKGFAC